MPEGEEEGQPEARQQRAGEREHDQAAGLVDQAGLEPCHAAAQLADIGHALGGQRLDLGHGAVLVVVALDGEHRAAHAGQIVGANVPSLELRVEPHVVLGQRVAHLAVVLEGAHGREGVLFQPWQQARMGGGQPVPVVNCDLQREQQSEPPASAGDMQGHEFPQAQNRRR